jgi:hypothetical protein
MKKMIMMLSALLVSSSCLLAAPEETKLVNNQSQQANVDAALAVASELINGDAQIRGYTNAAADLIEKIVNDSVEYKKLLNKAIRAEVMPEGYKRETLSGAEKLVVALNEIAFTNGLVSYVMLMSLPAQIGGLQLSPAGITYWRQVAQMLSLLSATAISDTKY